MQQGSNEADVELTGARNGCDGTGGGATVTGAGGGALYTGSLLCGVGGVGGGGS